MKHRFHNGSWLGLVLLISLSGLAQAQTQEAFVVAGTIDFYQDLTHGAPVGRTFSATVHYDPSAVASANLSSGLQQQVNFQDAVGDIELTIFDEQGLEIHRLVAEGLTANTLSSYILARKGAAGEDELFYEASSSDGFQANQAILSFKDLEGQLFGDLTTVPAPPDRALLEQAQLQFLSLDSAAGDGILTGLIQLRGSISLIDAAENDPYAQCATQARNHGQFVSCVAQVSRSLREQGMLTGRESGHQQRQAARKR
jgi:hypothetical protein